MALSPSFVASRAERTPSRPNLLGKETPRIFTPPLRELTPDTSLGFAVIEFSAEVLGIELLPWQKWLLIHALELDESGSFRFRTVVLLVARQNGKTTLMQVLSLFFMYVFGVSLVLGTAQSLDIAEEVWQGAVDIAEGIPQLASEIAKIDLANGKKMLKLVGGERYKVQTASRRGGRGLSGDLVLMDELREQRGWDAWGAITKTTMARANAMVWAASNAGDAGSVVLASLRTSAHMSLGNPDNLVDTNVTEDDPDADDESSDSLGIFEWSAAPGCSVWDREGWAQANPSLGYTITAAAISAAVKTDPEWVLRTEVLCQWAPNSVDRIISADQWAGCADEYSTAESMIRFAIDADPNQEWCSIALAGIRADELEHVELFDHSQGLAWVVPRMKAIRDNAAADGVVVGEVGIDPASTAGSLIEPLEAAGFIVRQVSGRELGQACAAFYTAVVGSPRSGALPAVAPSLRVRPDADLSSAVAEAKKRHLAEGWAWARKSTSTDLSPLMAVTLARHLVVTAPVPEEPCNPSIFFI